MPYIANDVLEDRVRSRGSGSCDFLAGNTRWNKWPTGVYTPTFTYSVEEEAETFIDKYQPYGVGVWGMKPCTHTKVKRHNCRPYPYYGTIPSFCPVGTDPYYQPGCNVTSTFGQTYFTFDDDTIIPSVNPITNADWSKVGQKWEECLPSLEGDAPDLFVFFSEMRDIGSLIQSRVIQLSVPGVITALAAEHLTNAFVLRPLIGDIIRLVKRMKRARKTYLGLVANQGKVITRYVRHNVGTVSKQLDDVKIAPSWCVGGSSSVDCPLGAKYVDYLTQGHVINVTGKFIYRFPPGMEVLYGQTQNIIEAFDLDFDLDAAWELIPFSFVVDWFFNTWRILSWAKHHSLDDLHITNTDMSVTTKTYSRLGRTIHWPCFMPTTELYVESEQYSRVVGPDALASLLPWFKMPSFMQWSYGAALLWLLLRK